MFGYESPEAKEARFWVESRSGQNFVRQYAIEYTVAMRGPMEHNVSV